MDASDSDAVLASVRQLFRYEPTTGNFLRLVDVRGGQKAGTVAGSLGGEGYVYIGVRGKKYRAHRLAFLVTHGRWPVADLDHVNGNRADNRLVNLREADRSQNLWNMRIRADNRSGIKGVCFDSQARKWRADIKVRGKRVHLGLFSSKEDAGASYAKASQEFFGAFAKADRS